MLHSRKAVAFFIKQKKIMLEIKEEFKKLIPSLTTEEFKQLEENCLAEGIREAILTWNGFIIDGHNRYEIATKWNLDYQTKSKHFESEIDVRIWMRNNQKGRRNLTKAWYIELELGNKEDLALKAKTTQGKRTDLLSQNDKKLIEPKHDTRKEIAISAGVSTGMVGMSEVIKTKNPELWEKAKAGEVTVTSAYKEIKKEEKKEEKELKIAEIKQKANDFKNEDIKIHNLDFRELNLKDGEIDLILTDPPYPAEFLPLWKDLFIMAKRVLKPNGFLIAYSGQMYLDKIFQYAAESGLDYYWLINIEFTKKPLVHGRKVLNEWKPILVFQNGLKQHDRVFSDKISMKYDERELHDLNWGQTIEPFEFLLDRFSNEMDLVFEPFAGTGTTLIACKNKKRRCIATEIETKYIDLIKGRL